MFVSAIPISRYWKTADVILAERNFSDRIKVFDMERRTCRETSMPTLPRLFPARVERIGTRRVSDDELRYDDAVLSRMIEIRLPAR